MGRKKGYKPKPISEQGGSQPPQQQSDVVRAGSSRDPADISRRQQEGNVANVNQPPQDVPRRGIDRPLPAQGMPLHTTQHGEPRPQGQRPRYHEQQQFGGSRQAQHPRYHEQQQFGGSRQGQHPRYHEQQQVGGSSQTPQVGEPRQQQRFQERDSKPHARQRHDDFKQNIRPQGQASWRGGQQKYHQRTENITHQESASTRGVGGSRDDPFQRPAGYGTRDSHGPKESAGKGKAWSSSTEPKSRDREKSERSFPAFSQKSEPADSVPKGPWGKASSDAKVESAQSSLSGAAPSTTEAKGSTKKKELKPKEKEPIPEPSKEVVGIKEKETYLYEIPKRKSVENPGVFFMKKFKVEVNYLKINFKQSNLRIYHYYVEFSPERPKHLLRPALIRLLQRVVPARRAAFDGSRNLYVAGQPLEFPNGRSITDTVSIASEDGGREVHFNISVTLTSQELNLQRLFEYSRNGTSLNTPMDVIQGIDIALKQAPIERPHFLQVGRSFFTPPDSTYDIDLSGGFELWNGLYQSAVVGNNNIYLNVDVANKAFPKSQHLLDYLTNDLRIRNLNQSMDPRDVFKLKKFIKSLKIEYCTTPANWHTERTQRIIDVGLPACQARFQHENEGEITVSDYFQRVIKKRLQFPALPTLKTSNGNLLPIEYCRVAPNQAVMRKLDEQQTTNMVRKTALSTDIRKRRIYSSTRIANYGGNQCLKEFGIQVDNNFTEVDAKILNPPRIQYRNRSVPLDNGVWRQDDSFFESSSLQNWAIINANTRETREHQIRNIISLLRNAGSRNGINVGEPRVTYLDRSSRETDFIKEFDKYRKDSVRIVLVILNESDKECYSNVKRAAEFHTGMLTQCVKSRTVNAQMKPMTASNILLKINAKLNGINHHAMLESIKPDVMNDPVMIVGADVTHPAPDSEGFSIAAVAASHDRLGFKYNMMYRLQPPKREMLDDLELMITKQLLFYYKKTSCKPSRILYFRDGVSEGQFNQVLNIELTAIKRACQKLDPEYRPRVTFVVVQKRHHARFFPNKAVGDGKKNNNVVAGTLVDTEITHPTEANFFLVSHQSIQGTARPTKYHLLWDDNNFYLEELEQLTYYLCHMFARCNRSVSYPAPTYYAHLAAFRARNWFSESYSENVRYDEIHDFAKLQQAQERCGVIEPRFMEESPMFFV